jgi:D-hydroxyproline dehydrogenase subunit gamma
VPDAVTLTVNSKLITVPPGTSVAAAVLIAGFTSFRRSVRGEQRGPLCAMGICFECRVTIDGVSHARSCQISCRSGMTVITDAK